MKSSKILPSHSSVIQTEIWSWFHRLKVIIILGQKLNRKRPIKACISIHPRVDQDKTQMIFLEMNSQKIFSCILRNLNKIASQRSSTTSKIAIRLQVRLPTRSHSSFLMWTMCSQERKMQNKWIQCYINKSKRLLNLKQNLLNE